MTNEFPRLTRNHDGDLLLAVGDTTTLVAKVGSPLWEAIVSAAAPRATAAQPERVPPNVLEAARRIKNAGYIGPLDWARKVFDWVASQEPVQSTEAQAKQHRPDVLERLTYHALERDDLTRDECLSFLAEGWRMVRGRTERQMVMQIFALLAGAPADAPDWTKDAREWGKALNDAGWEFNDAVLRHTGLPTTPRLFNYGKSIIRDVILRYAESVRAATQQAEPSAAGPGVESVYEAIIQWDEGGGKRSRRELARRIAALYAPKLRPEAEAQSGDAQEATP